MSPNQQRNRNTGLWMIADFVVILAAYSLVFLGRAATAPIFYGDALPLMVGCTLLVIASLYGFGVYRRIWSQTSGHEVSVIVYAVATATIIIAILDFPMVPRVLPLSVVFIGGILALAGVVGLRYNSRLISGLSWRWNAVWRAEFPLGVTRVLIVGAGESGQEFAWRLKHRFQDHSYQVVGFIDDDPLKQGMYVEGCPILGRRDDLVQVTEQHRIDLVVVAIHNISGADFRDIISRCEQTDARIKVVPDIFDLVRNEHSDVPLRDIQPEDLLGRSVVSWHKDVDIAPIREKVVLVTGAAGSIGSELSRQLMTCQPVKLVLVDNNESGLHDLVLELKALKPGIDLVPALVDVADTHSLRPVFSKYRPQIVFHAAAYKHVPMLELYPLEALRVNIRGTLNLAEMALNFDVERFVLVSTDKAVNPSSIMGASKRVGELMLHALSQEPDCSTLFAAVRFGNVLGSRGSVIPTFERQIDNGGPVTVTHQEMTRYFMSIPEAANLIIHAACLTQGDEIFILKMGEVVRIVDLAERMIRLRGLRPYKDIPIEFTGIRPGEKMHEQLYYGSENPVETAHPSIIKLNTWSERFDHGLFFAQVMALLTRSDIEDEAILANLQRVIGLNDEPPEPTNGKVSDPVTASG